MEIYYSAEIAGGFRILHGLGTIIGPQHRIGRHFTVYQNVTLGQRRRGAGEFITIGEDCTIYAGAKVLGAVRLGDGVRLGANSVLLTDAEPHSTYAGIPAVKVSAVKP
jgi:serine O-acetyltransferase